MIKNIKLSKYDKKCYNEEGVSIGWVNSFWLSKIRPEKQKRACPLTVTHTVQFSQNLILLNQKKTINLYKRNLVSKRKFLSLWYVVFVPKQLHINDHTFKLHLQIILQYNSSSET